MELVFLGTGSAFTVGDNNYHSNALLKMDNGKSLLIDCGSDARHSLNALGLSYKDINAVYISHYHADHSGGLEWLALARKFDPTVSKPDLYASEELIPTLWQNNLSSGLKTLDDEDATIETFFNTHHVSDKFDYDGLKVNLIRTHHFKSNKNWMPSFGIFFKANKTSVLFTTDTQFTPDYLMPYYEKADIIFHDCETTLFRSGVHSHFDQLKTLPDHIKKKMWLYHYNPGKLPDPLSEGFAGFVEPRQVFIF